MKIFPCNRIKDIDKYTIDNEPIDSIDLMERASKAISYWITDNYSVSTKLIIVVGPGNNGGDGLSLARILHNAHYNLKVIIHSPNNNLSAENQTNLQQLPKSIETVYVNNSNDIHNVHFDSTDIIIDALFGAGLSRPLDGTAALITDAINNSDKKVISIDIPSGIFGEQNNAENLSSAIKADITLSFQFPKLCFMFADCSEYINQWHILPIGLHSGIIESSKTPYHYTLKSNINLNPREEGFSHKGTFGHALLIAGSYGMMGAAVLAAKACLKTGCGQITSHIPTKGYDIMQISVPEAIVSIDNSEILFSDVPDIKKYSAVGIGPGLGTKNNTVKGFTRLLKTTNNPIVIDADAINILSKNKSLLKLLPENSILTPHHGEFLRLVGEKETLYDKIMAASNFAKEHKVVLVLKGRYSSVHTPSGEVFFNSTGNSGMSTAGSGDVLTGIILSLLAQKYTPKDSAIIGVYIHGLSADLALNKQSHESLIASDIIGNLGDAFKSINMR